MADSAKSSGAFQAICVGAMLGAGAVTCGVAVGYAAHHAMSWMKTGGAGDERSRLSAHACGRPPINRIQNIDIALDDEASEEEWTYPEQPRRPKAGAPGQPLLTRETLSAFDMSVDSRDDGAGVEKKGVAPCGFTSEQQTRTGVSLLRAGDFSSLYASRVGSSGCPVRSAVPRQ